MSSGSNDDDDNVVQLGFSVPINNEEEEEELLLGHSSPIWSDWDGGCIGGTPSWLQPRDIPPSFLTCQHCPDNAPMNFICQLYAPADPVNKNAFHRSLYVFGCPSCLQSSSSSSSSPLEEKTTGIRVIRGQLPQQNPFYPPTALEDDDEVDALQQSWKQHTPEYWNTTLCAVCGQRSKGFCQIQKKGFCGTHHQKEYKKYIFDKIQKNGSTTTANELGIKQSFLPSVYAESELVVEEEPPEGTVGEQESVLKKAEENAMYSSKDGDGDDDDEGNDADLDQAGLNEATGVTSGTKDPVTLAFYVRLGRPNNAQEQVLRYKQWPTACTTTSDDAGEDDNASGAPLWIRNDYIPKTIPSCEYCGASRKFEFQIMPQMLHYLLKNHRQQGSSSKKKIGSNSGGMSEEAKEAIKAASAIVDQKPDGAELPEGFKEQHEKALERIQQELLHSSEQGEMDWGVISVYTCTASCGGSDGETDKNLGAYKEEYAW
eukprot:CAMPEP_0195282162 /NCGR_PEP_ID=MMETSP0707-20130614/1161_1 /TAXON_ID=33640 /ORGANISM="Asterionellopsis glacialis, Strain CCMP134" /LENGTH=485 /DNA_ID=CAMNT_0040341115 /DNA_START=126 /DNA_END=1580 /DNA_ORIENTATION=-